MVSKLYYPVLGLLAYAAYRGGRYLYDKLGEHDTPGPVDLTFARTVADALNSKRSWKPADTTDIGKVDRHRIFFAFRRARDLGLADATLRAGAGLETLKVRVEHQFDLVDALLQKLLGRSSARGPYFGGEGGPQGEARLLDLGRYTNPRLIDPPPPNEAGAVAAATPNEPQRRTLNELDLRRMRVIGIVWHAAAIDDVWKGTGDAVTLDEVELTKLLDRRLRTVERLRYEASAGAVPGRIGSLAIDRAWDGTNKPSSLEGPMARRFCGPTIRGPEHSAFRAG